MRMHVLALLPIVAVACLLADAASALGEGHPAIVDVALGERGALVGQVVDGQGIGVVEQPVVLLQGSREIARATTDSLGYFSMEGIGGGVYQLVARDSNAIVRAWVAGTEPPVAQRGVLLVSGQEVYRGQQAVRSVRNFFAHPVTVVTVVAAGIAVPVALHHSRRKSPASP